MHSWHSIWQFPAMVLPPAFSWVAVHRDLMGDRFYDESKFYASNVHVILGRLDKVIREGGR